MYGTCADTRRKVPYVRYSLGVFPTNLALFAKKYRTYGTYGRIQKTCRQNPKPCDFEDFAKMYRTYGIFLQKANFKTGRSIAIGIFFRSPKSTGRSDKKWVPPFWSYPNLEDPLKVWVSVNPRWRIRGCLISHCLDEV